MELLFCVYSTYVLCTTFLTLCFLILSLKTGWSYAGLSETSSAKALAQQIAKEYMAQPRGTAHQTPKTIALIDSSPTSGVLDTFFKASNDLLMIMTRLLKETHDLTFFVTMHRARSSSISYANQGDAAAVDIGSLLMNIQDICNPDPKTELATALATTVKAYIDIFVEQAVGPGTDPGTGMIIDLPMLAEYNQNAQYWQDLLVKKGGDSHSLAKTVPGFAEFFKAYTGIQEPETSPEDRTLGQPQSVCTAKAIVVDDEPMTGRGTHMASGSTGSNNANVPVMDGEDDKELAVSEPGTGTAPEGSHGLFVDPTILNLAESEIEVGTNLQAEATSVRLKHTYSSWL